MHPIIDLTGSPYERGRQHGLKARSRVEHSVATYSKLFESCGIGWSNARRLAASYEDAIRSLDAGLLDEIRGIAAGAGRNMDEILALNAGTEKRASPVPTTAGIPNSLATTAPWVSRPPMSVTRAPMMPK